MSSARRPLIGICAACEDASWGAWELRADLLPRMYVDAVQAAGGAALLLPVDDAWQDDPQLIVERLDGLLLAGGVDVDPSSYHATPHETTSGCSTVRDTAELALLQCALERDLPVLGICRGMQLMNVLAGGDLIQHLPERYEGTHQVRVGSFEGSEHAVTLQPDSLLGSIVGREEIDANSHHHQGVGELGEGLVVTAHTDDGLVEALEDPTKRFAVGVQWHPEAADEDRIIPAFIAACAEHAVDGS